MYGEFINNWSSGQITHVRFKTLERQVSSNQVININLEELTLFLDHPFDIATGRLTPIGTFQVVEKWELPYQKKSDGTIVPSYSSHLIVLANMDGTKIPQGIHQWPNRAVYSEFTKSRYVSNGCIRTRPEDILSIYSKTELGATVNIF